MQIQMYEQIYRRAMELAQQAAIQLKDKSGSQNTVPRSPFDIFFCTEHTGKDRVRRALEPLQKYINTLSLDEALFLLTLVRVGRDCMPYDKLYTSLKHFTTVAEIAPKITETEPIVIVQYLQKGWDETARSRGID